MPQKYDYDAIIIGAGIGGLVCGCYLAKAGMKTLIVEKNAKPGGYCTSFTRQGFHFDACVHSLGSLAKGEIIAEVLKDLKINKRIDFVRYDPSDIVITPDHKISFYNDLDKTIKEFSRHFPKESENIRKFFQYVNNSEKFVHVELRKKTFKELLDDYFKDDKLKSVFAIFTLGNVGLPASLISAFTAVKFYKQFMLDGGYYPRGGVQKFPDILALRFKELGGNLLSLNSVKKIRIKDNIAEGVILKKNDKSITSRYVISGCDARQTFLDLVGEEKFENEFIKKLNKLIPSQSMIVLYLGLSKDNGELPREGVNIWHLPDYDLERMYKSVEEERTNVPQWQMTRLLSGKKCLLAFANVPFRNKKFWEANKNKIIEEYIDEVGKIFPSINKYIVYKDIATPKTLNAWTGNYRGASYGWAGIPSQFAVPGLSQATPIKNLYLTGHWTTLVQGVPGVVHIGKNTAKIILTKWKNLFILK